LAALPSFRERLVGRMLNVAPDEAAQDRLGLGGAEADGRNVLDHLVVLLADQLPVDRPGQNGLQVRVGIRLPDIGSGQLLNMDRLQPRHELEPQQPAERKGGRVLVVGASSEGRFMGAGRVHIARSRGLPAFLNTETAGGPRRATERCRAIPSGTDRTYHWIGHRSASTQ
jgi:hypothetical protein